MIRTVASVVLVAALAGCTGGPARSAATSPHPSAAGPSQAPTTEAPAPAATTPTVTTDGCHGLVSPGQVSRATGSAFGPGRGDAAAATAQYTQAVHDQGLQATVRLCPFTDPAGDQLFVLGLAFPDAAQAGRMYTGSAAIPGGTPVAVGDAAVSDRSRTLLARRGHSVVLVYLVRATNPDGDHLSALAAVASAALGGL